MTSSVPLKRVGGVTTAAIVLVAVSALVAVLTVLVGQSFSDEAETYLADGMSNTEFVEEVAPYLLLTLLQGALSIAAAVLVIIWMFRIAKNHRTLRRVGTWGPGWAIGGWFLPPLLYIIPTLMFRELWKASDPDVPVGGDWKSGRTSPLVWVWFVLYSLIPVILLFAQGGDTFGSLGGSEDQLAEQLTGSQTSAVIATAVTIAGAVAFIVLARALTSRHRRLIGESPGR